MKVICFLSIFILFATTDAAFSLARHRRSYSRCGENEAFTCSQQCNPTCEDRNPYCVQDCTRYGCQCIAGYVRQNGRCVHNTQCGYQSGSSRRCNQNSQCSVGYECVHGNMCRRISVSTSVYTSTVHHQSGYGSYSGISRSCTIDIDCPHHHICVNRLCSTTGNTNNNREIYIPSSTSPDGCRVHRDCGAGNRCIDRTCRPGSYMGVNEHVQSGTTLCRADRDCFDGKSCIANICRY